MIAEFQGNGLDGVRAVVELSTINPVQEDNVSVTHVDWVSNGGPKLGLAPKILSGRYRVTAVDGNNVRLFAYSNGS